MNKLTIIYLLLLFAFFTSSLGEECSDFNKFKSEMCCSVELDDPDKSCVFVNDKCKALPNDCSEYTGSDASECESIVPQTTSEICYFENNSCKSKPVSSCLAYKAGLPREICENIITSEGLKCELVNNECKPSYSDCSDYKGQDKNTCESIELEDFFKYCLYTEGKGCEEKDKTGLTCNSYTGHNSYYCEKIELEDEKRIVFFMAINAQNITRNALLLLVTQMKMYVTLTFLEIIININAIIKMDNAQKCKKNAQIIKKEKAIIIVII